MPTPSEKLHELSRRNERPSLVEEAAAVVGFDLGARPEYGTSVNVTGIRSRAYTYSRRLDSRTVFARNHAYGLTGRAGAWDGAARPLTSACRRIGRAAGIPPREIAAIDILTDLGQTANQEARGDDSEPTVLQRIAVARRVSDGLPVWSSYCSVALTRDAEIGEVEIHWPHLTDATVREAQFLGELAQNWKPAPREGAKVESVEAGIIHSPAIGFYMDTIPVIRVIYRALEGQSRKAVDYLDRHGDSVTLPRGIDIEPDRSEPRPPSPRG
jgi:hypothetical protein